MPGVPRNVNPAREITLFVGLTNNHLIYHLTFNNNSTHPRQFLRDKNFWNKLVWEMLIEQIMEFKSRGSLPLVQERRQLREIGGGGGQN